MARHINYLRRPRLAQHFQELGPTSFARRIQQNRCRLAPELPQALRQYFLRRARHEFAIPPPARRPPSAPVPPPARLPRAPPPSPPPPPPATNSPFLRPRADAFRRAARIANWSNSTPTNDSTRSPSSMLKKPTPQYTSTRCRVPLAPNRSRATSTSFGSRKKLF